MPTAGLPPETTCVIPQTRYAKSVDGVHIAYHVVGDGPIDLVFVMGWTSNIEAMWEQPLLARFLSRLASFSRLIVFDKRGVGLSDRVHESELPTLEQRMDDLKTVMDAAGSERAAVFGVSEGGPMSVLFAATYPERSLALILYGTAARFAWAPDFLWGTTPDEFREELERSDRTWGTREYAARALREWAAPTVADDEAMISWLAGYLRRAASPGAAVALERMNQELDVRHVLPSVHVPTLVLARKGDLDFAIDATRQMAGQIPGARLVEFPGEDHFFFVGDQDALLDEIERFGKQVGDEEAELDRVLATVLFTDIVGSTERAVEIGDKKWKEVLEAHHSAVRSQLARFRGREVDTSGDGFLATFDGPARAIRCAQSIRERVRALGVEIRAGLHAGECEMVGEKVGGIAVHIGARVAAVAAPGEVLVSQTVKDLVAGSGLQFQDRGIHALKGLPGEWRLFSVL